MYRITLAFLLSLAGCDAISGTEDPDADGDGSPASEDCDDADAKAHPGAIEVCDTVDRDEDCNGLANIDDPDVTGLSHFFADVDDDGYGDEGTVVVACDIDYGLTSEAGDCDDTNPNVHPEGQEVCDAADNDEDCDGLVDDEDPSVDVAGYSVWNPDADGDGYGTDARELEACDAPSDWVSNTLDCDDHDNTVNPDAIELCDGIDDDCDGFADGSDSADAGTWYADADEDGYGDNDATRTACELPDGFIAVGGDCDDTRPLVNPGGTELCNGQDDDCDGDLDESGTDASTWFRDTDGDGYGDATASRDACDAPANYVANDDDCDDAASGSNPGATEVCDAADVDEDCDGYADDYDDSTDAAGKTSLYYDGDGDGYGLSTVAMDRCDTGTGWSTTSDDCDDDKASVHPGASEVCDSADTDEDCDGLADDDDAGVAAGGKTTYYLDADADGYGLTASSVSKCNAPSGYATGSGDCDDSTSARSPGNTEVCDAANLDEDCDTVADDNDPSVSAASKTSWFVDLDADTYGDDAGTGIARCESPVGYAAGNTDCDDGDANVNPGELDVCFDTTDSDCDGSTSCELTSDDADREFIGETAGDVVGYPTLGLDAAGDVNGDGYDDVIVGALYNDSGGSNAGRAYVVFGGVSGDLDLSAANGILTGEDTSDLAGYAVAGIGDFNGDGYDDVAVSATSDDDLASAAGAVYIVKGPVTSVDLSAATYKLRGTTASYSCGSVLAPAGDVNGTGKGAVLIATTYASTNKGIVYLVTTAATGSSSLASASAILTGESTSDYAGYSMDGGVDINGDGADDFIVGAPYDDDVGSDGGAAYVFLGPVTGSASMSTADAKVTGYSSSDNAGQVVGTGRDVSGDGYADVAIYASGYGSGTTYIVNGPISGSVNVSSVVDATLTPFGVSSLDLGGDVDGDGTGDFLVGNQGSGVVYGFFGPLSGSLTTTTADLSVTGTSSTNFGGPVRFIGDHDGDGQDDFAVAAYGNDDGGADAGAAYVFLNAGF